jgi:putative ABC transport system permease protein
VKLAPQTNNTLSFILVKATSTMTPAQVAKNIHAQTGLQALTREELRWRSIDHYLKRTGIPINFGITVLLGFIVGAVVAGQTFFIFVLENLREFGTLKAIGVTNHQILCMVLLQAAVVGSIGFALGIGLTGLFFKAASGMTALKGIGLIWQIIVITGAAAFIIMVIACFSSIRRVVKLDPAIVFKG